MGHSSVKTAREVVVAKSERVKGDLLIEMLLAASPGEQMLVGEEQMTSLGNRKFEVIEDFGDGKACIVALDEDQNVIDPDAFYDFQR